MSDPHSHDDSPVPAPEPVSAQVSRRALIRAGLSAAPVVAAFKTDLVLATTSANSTVRPSSFASFINNRLSTAPGRNTTGSYLPLSECRSRCQTTVGTKRFLHHSIYSNCGFSSYTSCGVGTSDTLRTVINRTISTSSSSQLKLSVYCAAAFLAAEVYPGSSILTKTQCLEIWRNKGAWKPMAGVSWDLAKTLAYFDRVYGVGGATFDACLTGGPGGTSSGC